MVSLPMFISEQLIGAETEVAGFLDQRTGFISGLGRLRLSSSRRFHLSFRAAMARRAELFRGRLVVAGSHRLLRPPTHLLLPP